MNPKEIIFLFVTSDVCYIHGLGYNKFSVQLFILSDGWIIVIYVQGLLCSHVCVCIST